MGPQFRELPMWEKEMQEELVALWHQRGRSTAVQKWLATAAKAGEDASAAMKTPSPQPALRHRQMRSSRKQSRRKEKAGGSKAPEEG